MISSPHIKAALFGAAIALLGTTTNFAAAPRVAAQAETADGGSTSVEQTAAIFAEMIRNATGHVGEALRQAQSSVASQMAEAQADTATDPMSAMAAQDLMSGDMAIGEDTGGEEDPAPEAFSFETVIEKSRELSDSDFKRTGNSAPGAAEKLSYDQYRRIEFKREEAEWAEGEASLFHAHFDPQGFLFKQAVRINLVRDGVASQRDFDPSEFNFFDLPLSDSELNALEYAGFRVTTPLNRSGKFDDLINFRGASFFRVLAAGTRYGASGRGLAIATGSPGGEEFPYFKEFWLVAPEPNDVDLTIYALMDSPSTSGAFKFVVTPGAQTRVDVEAVFHPRKDISEAGIAPVTSMFDFAPHDPHVNREDFRPEVHDSDGLMIRLKSGEWVWRPLKNPRQLEISSFSNETPLGFGLMQRERSFEQYQDLEAHYHLRPSVWITPRANWGEGQLTLVEIPTGNEFNDNIVAFWKPRTPWKAGVEKRVAYTMHWGLEPPIFPNVASISDTRVGISPNSGNRLFVIDYSDDAGAMLEDAEATVSASSGAIVNLQLIDNQEEGGKRLSFELKPNGSTPAELRVVLEKAGKPVSETWLYRWSPR